MNTGAATTACRATVLAALALAMLGPLPGTARAAPPDYRIGTDDVLAISVWDQKELDTTVFVRPDGKISLPLLGEVQAGGLTVAELATKLNEDYGKTVKGAQVTVSVKDIRSRPVFFVGGVGKPGPLQLTQDLFLLQAISLAGGLAPTADLESAFVLRNEQAIPVDFVQLIQKGDVRQNVKLQPGDTVVIPVAESVFVQGEVKAPGALRYTKELTMLKAIAQVGGFTNLAAPKRVTLLRGQGTKRENRRVNVDEMIREPEAAADFALRPNDIIIVPQRLF
jgi:polysaccharide biosynthesis/export protein